MTCTFFGHKTFYKPIEGKLEKTIIELIEKENVDKFYVGNNGHFDSMVYRILKKLTAEYDISCTVVLAYAPVKKSEFDPVDYSDTVLPDGIENVPRRFAISHRNKWMIERADYVITYVITHIGSGAAQFKKLAENKGKTVINIAEDDRR